MNKKTSLNKKKLEFADEHCLYILGQYGRNRRVREAKYYTVSTDTDISLGRVKPDCSYEQFLEEIAINAISEAERLSDLCIVQEEEYGELYDNYATLKEEVIDEREDN